MFALESIASTEPLLFNAIVVQCKQIASLLVRTDRVIEYPLIELRSATVRIRYGKIQRRATLSLVTTQQQQQCHSCQLTKQGH